ncbi:DUF2285 domain-containing protein [Bradyrhizobium diazoefficiens]|nr:hypothetical protein RN69_00250 [Bradyrhizobium japonicum]AND94539.1 hypothetical protein AAV28_39510 [Bradyrhizobium diazoefficiens USDA 110]AWO94941.2 DUF2285 domain-containing protein [Bradyrhizobium diazoefficiens]OIM88841.1 hypothetical protein BLN97_43090 [Bradyrhizobium elkanii]KOY06263.1 hypothetical protein AF336_32975 [Bradyrhizobium diazoefficiens]
MPTPSEPVSHVDGGCGVAHDPASPVWPEPAIWLPEASPGTLILTPAPPDFETVHSIDRNAFGLSIVGRTDADGRELVVADGSGELHVSLRDEQAARRPAVLVPLDGMGELRADVALHFVRRLSGQRTGLLPAALRLTSFQKRRLIQLLHAFDVHDLGGGPRDVAAKVLASDHAQRRSVEWKDSHARRKANRLIHDSIALVERGYLKLLRGL